MDNMNVQSDHEPLRVVRQADQNVHYKQQVNVRFLQPPQGPEPAPIIIKVRLSRQRMDRAHILRRLGTSRTGSTPTTTRGDSPTSTNTAYATSTHHP